MLQLNDKRVLVVGLGDTGLSAARWLTRQGARLSIADSRVAPPNLAQVQAELPQAQIFTGTFASAVFEQAEVIVLSPGVSIKEPLVQYALARQVPVVGDVELFAQYKPQSAKVIAITGSNGKSTVTSLVGAMCQAAGLNTIVAGNIGLPVLDTLSQPAPDVYVLELSSFQLETTCSLNADAATMLNLSEDHLDRHDDMQDYAHAKRAVFNGHGVQVLNRDDAFSLAMTLAGRPLFTFGSDVPRNPQEYGTVRNGHIHLLHGDETLLALHETRLSGLHNATNILAALALCHAIGLPNAPLLAAAKAFAGLPHRVQHVANINHVDYVDDSKGTNVGATCAAIAGLQQTLVPILGGDGKGQDFTPLVEPVRQKARAVVLIGRDAAIIEKTLLATQVPMYHAADMHEAVTIAARMAQAGDAVLLSPACASLDMYRNYVHRAEAFITAVNTLKGAAHVAN